MIQQSAPEKVKSYTENKLVLVDMNGFLCFPERKKSLRHVSVNVLKII